VKPKLELLIKYIDRREKTRGREREKEREREREKGGKMVIELPYCCV